MAKVYKLILNEENFNKIQKLGYIADPPYLKKEVKIDYYSLICQTIKNLFNDKDFQKEVLSNKVSLKTLKQNKISYNECLDSSGEESLFIVEDVHFKNFISSWTIMIDAEDKILELVNLKLDEFPYFFYDSIAFNESCKEEVELLLKENIIEEVEESEY